MQRFLPLYAVAVLLLLNSCMKDLSCYRDMIIGTWVEETFDGQVPATNLRGVHTFDHSNAHKIMRMVNEDENNRIIGDFPLSYMVTCKIMDTWGNLKQADESLPITRSQEILRFTDSTLLVRTTGEIIDYHVVMPDVSEVSYRKVSADNANAKTIQTLWEMSESDPPAEPFRIQFLTGGSYRFFQHNTEGKWEEKTDENGKYSVYDSFMMTSFFNNPTFGTPAVNDVACWNLVFENEATTMHWSAVVYNGEERTDRRFSFIRIAE